MILIDTREKPKAIKGIIEYFDRCDITYDRTKLYFGDYMDYQNPALVIDRKQNIAELAKNCTSEHKRFRDELKRAKAAGATIVLLVEENAFEVDGKIIHVDCADDLMKWSFPYTTIKGETVFRIISSWMAKYPLHIEFCDKRETGRRILEILYRNKYKQHQSIVGSNISGQCDFPRNLQ